MGERRRDEVKAKLISIAASMFLASLLVTAVAAQTPTIMIMIGQGTLTSSVWAFPQHWPNGWGIPPCIPLATEGHRCSLSFSVRKIGDVDGGSGLWIDEDYEEGMLRIELSDLWLNPMDYPWLYIHGTAKAYVNGEYRGEYKVFLEGHEDSDIRIYLHSGVWSEPWDNCWYYAGGHGLDSGRIVRIVRS